MADRKINFTAATIEKLPTPDATIYYRDTRTEGLWLRVTKTGVKTFVVNRWVQTKPIMITLGRFCAESVFNPDFEIDPLAVLGKNALLNVEQARKLARTVVSQLAMGKDPTIDSRKHATELTLSELFREYIERHAKKNKKTWQVMIQDFDRNASVLRNKKLSSITFADIESLHADLAMTRGRYTANRTIQLLRAVFNKGILWKLHGKENPATGITLFREKARERFLSNEEIKRLLQALETETDDLLRDFITLSIFTGARKANLFSMRFSDVDQDKGVWVIPETKNGSSQTIALTVKELTLIERRRRRVTGDFVFPGNGRSGHIVDLKTSWSRLRKKTNLEDCTIHDLRRNLGSWMASQNVNVALIKSALNHKDLKTTLNVYARTAKDAERDAREVAHKAMYQAAGLEKPEDKVIELAKRATPERDERAN